MSIRDTEALEGIRSQLRELDGKVDRIATALEMIAERLAKAQELEPVGGRQGALGTTCNMCGDPWPVGESHVCNRGKA